MKTLLDVASIQPADGDRIYLSLKKEGKIWRILASTGEDIDSEFKSRQEALNAIESFWGAGGGWDLQWHI
jgi:hypothetical protein